jgi:hypothetical protein
LLLLFLKASDPVLLYMTNKLAIVSKMMSAQITRSPRVFLTKLSPMPEMAGEKSCLMLACCSIRGVA